MCIYIYIATDADIVTIAAPPENITVCRGSDVTISCGYVIARAKPITWIINGTSFSQEQIFSSSLYKLNRQATPTENSLIVFFINGTTTFQCVVLSDPTTTSTLGTVAVIGMYIDIIYLHTCGTYVQTYVVSKFYGPQQYSS